MQGQRQLLKAIATLSSSGGFSCLLNGWQQQCNQQRDNGNYDQQFDKREAPLAAAKRKIGTAQGPAHGNAIKVEEDCGSATSGTTAPTAFR